MLRRRRKLVDHLRSRELNNWGNWGLVHAAFTVKGLSIGQAKSRNSAPEESLLWSVDLSMTLGETLILVWQQSLAGGREEVDLGYEFYPVAVFRAKKLQV